MRRKSLSRLMSRSSMFLVLLVRDDRWLKSFHLPDLLSTEMMEMLDA
jgi:hypothetical protein